jgi:hypothetical protein
MRQAFYFLSHEEKEVAEASINNSITPFAEAAIRIVGVMEGGEIKDVGQCRPLIGLSRCQLFLTLALRTNASEIAPAASANPAQNMTPKA